MDKLMRNMELHVTEQCMPSASLLLEDWQVLVMFSPKTLLGCPIIGAWSLAVPGTRP